jgi:hypothetical protein
MKRSALEISPKYLQWLIDTGNRITIADGKSIEVWEFRHQNDDVVLSEWAKHFRNHYCLDSEIDAMRKGTGLSRKDYLNRIKFPDGNISKSDPSTKLGPSARAGDFGEILISDFLEFMCGYTVPRTRYNNKVMKNSSTMGSDILGFNIINPTGFSSNDTLIICETKTQFSKKKKTSRLQDAINSSKIDERRKGESLNAMKQRLRDVKQFKRSEIIERFQNPVDNTYKELFEAAVIFEDKFFSDLVESSANTTAHPNNDKLLLIVIKGDEMMPLVHELYRRAADEA